MKGSIIAINQEAREHGMSYGKYLALRAAEKAPVGVGRRPYYEAGCSAGLGRWRHQPRAQRAPAPGREEETTAKLKRSMPPGASLAGKNLPQGRLLPKLAQVYGLSPDKLARIFGGGKTSKSALGHALRQARLRAGLGVEEAARQMDVTASAVRQWETGKNRPSWKSQQKIARVYGLSMEEIFRLLEEAGS